MSDPGIDNVRAVLWRDGLLYLLDQRRLPAEEMIIQYSEAGEVAEAIRDMVVRGAPAIGITAAYGVVLAARRAWAVNPTDWRREMAADLQRLETARPPAVNLAWAVGRMRAAVAAVEGDPEPALAAEALAIHEEDIAANRTMGELGAGLMDATGRVITHCNTGSLATGGYGTALGVIRSGFAAGRITSVYADETRPWLQGARLTAWELVKDGIPVELIADGAAAHIMKGGGVTWAITGSDRIAANGDVANKIGTYGLAVNARHHGVRFMVVAPTSTVDMAIASGADIPIEERPAGEVLTMAGRPIAPPGAGARNPAFDITPAALIDAIVTERGVVWNPDAEAMAALMARPARPGRPTGGGPEKNHCN